MCDLNLFWSFFELCWLVGTFFELFLNFLTFQRVNFWFLKRAKLFWTWELMNFRMDCRSAVVSISSAYLLWLCVARGWRRLGVQAFLCSRARLLDTTVAPGYLANSIIVNDWLRGFALVLSAQRNQFPVCVFIQQVWFSELVLVRLSILQANIMLRFLLLFTFI